MTPTPPRPPDDPRIPQDPRAAVPGSAAALIPLRLLVLEDRVDDAEVMVLELFGAGYAVDWTRVDDEAGFSAALGPHLDVILADFTLPSYNVRHALTRLRESGLSVPFIVVSGTISEEGAVDCLTGGAADYLIKERLARLPAAVAAAMSSRALHDEQHQATLRLQAQAGELAAQARELADANVALRRADELKGQLLAITAHELRTPITAILGFAELLSTEAATISGDDLLTWSSIIVNQAGRLQHLVEDLLTFTGAELGAVDLHPAPLPVAQALAHAISIAGPATASLACPEDLLVYADPARFEQIITNLLTNAAKYGGPEVLAEAHADGDYVEVRVSDNGPGVPEKFIPDLFETFSRAHNQPGDDGFGLGLAIVRSLTTAHGGTVWYGPATPTGACFTVRLPRPRTSPE